MQQTAEPRPFSSIQSEVDAAMPPLDVGDTFARLDELVALTEKAYHETAASRLAPAPRREAALRSMAAFKRQLEDMRDNLTQLRAEYDAIGTAVARFVASYTRVYDIVEGWESRPTAFRSALLTLH